MRFVGANVYIGPFVSYEFAEDYRKAGALCRADVGIGPYEAHKSSVGNSELLQISREKSRKTEEVFQVGSRRAGGKSKSIRARFLLEKQKKVLKGSHKFLI